MESSEGIYPMESFLGSLNKIAGTNWMIADGGGGCVPLPPISVAGQLVPVEIWAWAFLINRWHTRFVKNRQNGQCGTGAKKMCRYYCTEGLYFFKLAGIIERYDGQRLPF